MQGSWCVLVKNILLLFRLLLLGVVIFHVVVVLLGLEKLVLLGSGLKPFLSRELIVVLKVHFLICVLLLHTW